LFLILKRTFEENILAADIELTAEDLREIESSFSKTNVHGAQPSEAHMKLIGDTA